MKKALYSILIMLPSCAISQTFHEGLVFSQTEFNFTRTENWVNHIDSIEVTNITEKKIFLLKQFDPSGFELRYPAKSIDPGKTEYIEIAFKPKQKGKFHASFPIYHSASPTPVTITYSGEVASFDEFAEAACPSFSKPNLKPAEFDMEISVIDSATQEPLSNSPIEITIGENFNQASTDGNGSFRQKATINFYIVMAEHPGYNSRSVEKHVNPKNRKIIIALPLIEKTTPLIPGTTSSIIKSDSSLFVPELKSGFALSDYKRNNIVFLIDKSSSMNKPDCMPYLKTALSQLATMARAEDRITIITYANEAKIVLSSTPGSDHEKINGIIQQLKCGGKTEGGKAIQAAYKNAEENFIKGGVNQVIIATDGGFNGLSENETELMQLAGTRSNDGIKLSVLAFGQNRFGKAMIMRLAKQGQGFYVFIPDENDAKEKLSENIKLQSKIK